MGILHGYKLEQGLRVKLFWVSSIANCNNKNNKFFFKINILLGLDSSIFAHLKRNWSWNAGLKRGEKVEKLTKPPFCISLLQDERY